MKEQAVFFKKNSYWFSDLCYKTLITSNWNNAEICVSQRLEMHVPNNSQLSKIAKQHLERLVCNTVRPWSWFTMLKISKIQSLQLNSLLVKELTGTQNHHEMVKQKIKLNKKHAFVVTMSGLWSTDCWTNVEQDALLSLSSR